VAPDPIQEYTRTRPIFTVDLDAGVFFWIKEIIEAKQRVMRVSHPDEYKELVARAIVMFEQALSAKTEAIEAATAPRRPVRRIRRNEPPAKRSGVKRLSR
jgi:hypothetical protein